MNACLTHHSKAVSRKTHGFFPALAAQASARLRPGLRWRQIFNSPGDFAMITRSHSLAVKRTLSLALVAGAAALSSAPALAQEVDSNITACLKAWGKHPFGNNPQYKTMQVSVKVFGIGAPSADRETTSKPALVLVQPGVNVMGGSTVELLNPNGWYCLKTNVNVMGGLTIRAACGAKLASTHDGTTVMSNNEDNKAVTVMGSTQIERVGCDGKN